MNLYIHKRGFDHLTNMAWVLCIFTDDDSGLQLSTTRYTFLLPRKSPSVIVRPGYDPPQILKRTAEGWVEYEHEFKKEVGENFTYTSGASRLIGADGELDDLHAALLSVVPHSVIGSFARHCITVLSHIYRTLKEFTSKRQANPKQEQRNVWKLCHAVIDHLGKGWQVDASALQNGGEYRGIASGPDDMRLFFIARTENLDPRMEAICPPLGWLRVDGRLPCSDADLSAELSIELRESLPPEEMANEITVRLLPVYRDFLGVMAKYHPQGQPSEERVPEPSQVPEKTLTEQQAASYFVRCMLEESARNWPDTYEALKTGLGNKFVLEDEKMASFDWCLAAISLGLQGVKNTFPPEQATRIEKLIFTEMNDNRAIDEVKQYEAALQKGREETLSGPLGGVPGRLLHRWLGRNIRNCEAEILGKKTGFIDTWAMLETERVLTELAVSWSWKKIGDDFNLVPSPELSDGDFPS